MDVPVFLLHLDEADATTWLPLDRYNGTSTFYLPDNLELPLNVTHAKDAEHSCIRLDLEEDHGLLSVYGKPSRPVIVLANTEVEIPISTADHRKSFIVTQDQQIVTAVGRWELVWDEFGTVSRSMRPPAPPIQFSDTSHLEAYDDGISFRELVPSIDGKGLVDWQEVGDVDEDDRGHVPIPVAEIHLTPESSEEPVSSGQQNQNQGDVESMVQSLNSGAQDKLDKDKEVVRGDVNEIGDESAPQKTDDGSIQSTHVQTPSPDEASASEQYNETQRTPEARTVDMFPALAHDASAPLLESHTDGTRNNPETSDNELRPRIVIHLGSDLSMNVDTESEDESQQLKDTKILKGRIHEIEHENSPVETKKRKLDPIVEDDTNHKQVRWADELENTIVVVETDLSVIPAAAGNIPDMMLGVTSNQMNSPEDRSAKSKTCGTQTADIKSGPVRRSPRSPRHELELHRPSSFGSSIRSGNQSPLIVFGSTSSIPADKRIISSIEELGARTVTDIDQADVLCIGTGRLRKTSKFIIAIATGKDIVTDAWAREAHSSQTFPNPRSFLPKDSEREKQWHFSLPEAIDRGKCGLKLLEGSHVYLTTQLRKDLGRLTKDLKKVAMALGAIGVHSGLPVRHSKDKALVIGSTKNFDPEGAKVGRLGHKLYSQDILTMAALRGRLEDNSDEFLIHIPVKEQSSE